MVRVNLRILICVLFGVLKLAFIYIYYYYYYYLYCYFYLVGHIFNYPDEFSLILNTMDIIRIHDKISR